MDINGIVTLTTDFGIQDPYAGMMKGVILAANREARIVDITHDIPAHGIMTGAFTFARSFRYFPPGTIHVAVVDPGVGAHRKSIAVLTDDYIFIGPDNGLMSIAAGGEHVRDIREIANPPFMSELISPTFHGRDVFAPCAGELSRGDRRFEDIGPGLDKIHKLEYPRTVREGNILRGEVVSIDSFGNMITNISGREFKEFTGKSSKIDMYFGTERFDRLVESYYDVPSGSPLILTGSSGCLEISMNEGSAEKYFMTGVGSTITIRRY